MKYYLAYDLETFKEAVASAIIPARSIEEAVAYAKHDCALRMIETYRVYNENGEMVFNSLSITETDNSREAV